MKRSDVLLGGAAVALGIAVFLLTQSFPKMPGGAPGPALFPQLLSVLMIVFGSWVVLAARHPHTENEENYEPINVLKAGLVLVGIGLYVALVQKVGFLITASLLLIGLMVMLGVRFRVAVPASVVIAGGCVILFERVLRVPLQTGIFGG
ncbi:MAG TPA: tripartite tricarboxylate transporter TctB family protein [Chloroflexota bacterium]